MYYDGLCSLERRMPPFTSKYVKCPKCGKENLVTFAGNSISKSQTCSSCGKVVELTRQYPFWNKNRY